MKRIKKKKQNPYKCFLTTLSK